MPNTPQAFCCINDSVAIICCELLKKMGLNVPKDVAVTGFDNILVSETNSPPITTIIQYYYVMGYYAAKLCLDTSFKGFTKISLPVTLVERESTEKNI